MPYYLSPYTPGDSHIDQTYQVIRHGSNWIIGEGPCAEADWSVPWEGFRYAYVWAPGICDDPVAEFCEKFRANPARTEVYDTGSGVYIYQTHVAPERYDTRTGYWRPLKKDEEDPWDDNKECMLIDTNRFNEWAFRFDDYVYGEWPLVEFLTANYYTWLTSRPKTGETYVVFAYGTVAVVRDDDPGYAVGPQGNIEGEVGDSIRRAVKKLTDAARTVNVECLDVSETLYVACPFVSEDLFVLSADEQCLAVDPESDQQRRIVVAVITADGAMREVTKGGRIIVVHQGDVEN